MLTYADVCCDVIQVETSYELPKNISSGNWKSFLPVSLDGSTYISSVFTTSLYDVC
jgi:hypothetical protein